MREQNAALLGAYIRIRREAQGWSLRELASRAGIAHTTVDNIEHGYDPRTGRATNLTLDTLEKLSAALHDSPATLLACLDGTARVVLSRPLDSWHEDEREDMERERGGVREYLRIKWGHGSIVLPQVDGDEAAAKRFLFGAHTPDDATWQQVIQYARFLSDGTKQNT